MDKSILESYRLGTCENLSPSDNVMVVAVMEGETIRLAKENNFYGILSNNTNPLTQQLAVSVYGYEELLDYQTNQFGINGRKPFDSVPDSTRSKMHWKII